MPKRKTSHKIKKRGLWKYFFLALLICTLIGGSIVYFLATDLPNIEDIQKTGRKPSILFQNPEGQTLALYGDVYGDMVSPKALPPHVIQAFLSIEDRRFYSHFGVDILGIMRALYYNILGKKSLQGASTLTQQLAKNFLISAGKFDVSDRSLKRKIQEVLFSFWLEKTFSKDDILMMYLNRSYFGSGTLGIDGASRKYFGKQAQNLNVMEACVLAGLLKAPSKYSPHHNPHLAMNRAKTVLHAMVSAGYITGQKAGHLPAPHFVEQEQGGSSVRYFFDWILDTVPNLIGVINEDIVINTTLDVRLQKHAHEVLNHYIKIEGKKHNVSQGAVLILDRSGAVKAMVGGKSYRHSSFNRVTQAQRQPGSAFKLFVYLAALENGFDPDFMMEDKRRLYGKWSPRNYTNTYQGMVSLKKAFAESLNTVAVELCHEVGIDRVVEMARRLGVTSEIPHNLSIALGSCDVTLLELATSYGVIANMGQEVRPFGVLSISNREGHELYQNPVHMQAQLLDIIVTQIMDDLLRDVISLGTGKRAQVKDLPLSGKTGTTQDYKDAVFVGYTNDYIIAVWLGNDNGEHMKKITGGNGPALIFKDIVQSLVIPETQESIESILKQLETE